MSQNNNPNFIFFGTDEFAVRVLEELHAHGHSPSTIVTTPDTPQGRKLILTPPPVAKWATQHNIEYLQPEKLDADFSNHIATKKASVLLVASYGKILPEHLLHTYPHNVWNIHPSLLPLHRGPSPIESAILSNDITGVTLMELDEEMDHGPILAQEILEGAWPLNYTDARDRLAEMGARLFIDALETPPAPQRQDHAKATYTQKIVKSDAELDLTDPAEHNWRKVLAYCAWPRAFYFEHHAGKKIRVVVTEAHLENEALVIDRVIPEGKKEMNYQDFKRGLR